MIVYQMMDVKIIFLKRKRKLDTPSEDSSKIIHVSANVVPDSVRSSYRRESIVNDRVNRCLHRTK